MKQPRQGDMKLLKTMKPVKTSKRVERILKKKEPQLIEPTKCTLLMKGQNSSHVLNEVLPDLCKLLKPFCKMLSRKNEIFPFEDTNSLEFLCEKNDSSLFVVGSHTKKRPNNLVMGRTYDNHVLDIIEFGIDDHKLLESFPGSKKAVGSKPLMVFLGSQWDTDSTYKNIQNYFIDLFRGVKLDKISLQGIDHVLTFVVNDGKIFMRSYSVIFKKSGGKIPNVELVEMGPFLNLSLRRTQMASEDMWKTALKRPKGLAPNKKKNIKKDALGEKTGRIHMKRQDLDKMSSRRMKGLRTRSPKNKDTNMKTNTGEN